jgi:phospholipid transport system substrate-binding protein
MKRIVWLLAVFLLATVVGAAPPAGTATALVEETSEEMLRVLDARRDEIDREPQKIYRLVETIVLPHFDFERITRGAVARHWREASPAQRRELVEGFREVLVRTYARALLSYSDQEIRYLPERATDDGQRVTVTTEVRDRGGAVIKIDYRLYWEGSAWKVYDLVVDNVSLVASYRGSFASIIRSDGIDGLVDRLGEMNLAGHG